MKQPLDVNNQEQLLGDKKESSVDDVNHEIRVIQKEDFTQEEPEIDDIEEDHNEEPIAEARHCPKGLYIPGMVLINTKEGMDLFLAVGRNL